MQVFSSTARTNPDTTRSDHNTITCLLPEWLEAQHREVLPTSPMGEAIGYALNNWEALRRYTEAGFLAIDNNAAEREMKRIAIGRKNC
jgi:hypothetical protein